MRTCCCGKWVIFPTEGIVRLPSNDFGFRVKTSVRVQLLFNEVDGMHKSNWFEMSTQCQLVSGITTPQDCSWERKVFELNLTNPKRKLCSNVANADTTKKKIPLLILILANEKSGKNLFGPKIGHTPGPDYHISRYTTNIKKGKA